MAESYVQVPPDSTGKKVRTVEVAEGVNTVEQQVVTPADPLTGQAQYVGPGGHAKVAAVPRPPGGWGSGATAATQLPRAGLLFHHDFRYVNPSMYNDAQGACFRDTDVTFMGRPTARLDPLGVYYGANSATQAGGPIDNNGVIYKVRLASPQTGAAAGVYGMEMWLRFTTNNIASDCYPSMALYYRDGTNAYHSKVWFDVITDSAGKLIDLKYFSSAGSFTQFAQYKYDVTGHAYNPFAKLYDRAGGWHYCKLVTDMGNLKYVSFQFNEKLYDLSANSIRTQASTSQTMLHFSVEMNQNTTSRRWINIADLVGTQEG